VCLCVCLSVSRIIFFSCFFEWKNNYFALIVVSLGTFSINMQTLIMLAESEQEESRQRRTNSDPRNHVCTRWGTWIQEQLKNCKFSHNEEVYRKQYSRYIGVILVEWKNAEEQSLVRDRVSVCVRVVCQKEIAQRSFCVLVKKSVSRGLNSWFLEFYTNSTLN
jgi:hypothetical protein